MRSSTLRGSAPPTTTRRKTADRASEAADALKIRATDLCELGVADGIIEDYDIGSEAFADRLAGRLVEELEPLERMTADELVDARYERFRRMGKDALC